MIRKKRNRSGFSLAETLVAILILLMVSAIVAGAIPTASNVYAKTVDAANAQVLLSTVITVLRDELSNATSIEKTDDTTIKYINGSYRKLVLQGESESADGPAPGIWLCIGVLSTDSTSADVVYSNPGGENSRLLVSKEATTKNLTVKFDSLDYIGGVVIFHNLRVERSGVTLASRESFRIRTIK